MRVKFMRWTCNAQVMNNHCAMIHILDGVYDLTIVAGIYMIRFQFF